LSRYSNKIVSVGLRKCPYYRYLIEKVTSNDVRITQTFRRACPTKWRKATDMKKLRHCHLCIWNSDFSSILARGGNAICSGLAVPVFLLWGFRTLFVCITYCAVCIGWQWRNFFVSYLCQQFYRH